MSAELRPFNPDAASVYVHERPTPVQEPCRPDVVDRVKPDLEAARAAGTPAALFNVDDIADLVAAVVYLRAVGERHCDDERDLKAARARIATLEASIAGRPGVEGAPLVLYCATAADRDEVIAAFHAAKPGAFEFSVP